jgi:aminoglycoside phosphotransferase (APT) family kinase protein
MKEEKLKKIWRESKMKIHKKNILFLQKFLYEEKFNWIDYEKNIEISYFSKGGGTNIYLIINDNKKLLARINYYSQKNIWKTKRQEYKILKIIEKLNISPKVYVLNEKSLLKQDFTIVDYIEGEEIKNLKREDIILLAKTLKKLHGFKVKYPKKELPYHCEIFDEFAKGKDKKIENYKFKGIEKIAPIHNNIKRELGRWFHELKIFDDCKNICLCHADLKRKIFYLTKKRLN